MSGRIGDELLAYETLAAAAADPAVGDFDFSDLKVVEAAAEGRPRGWVAAAAAFFAYRRERGEGRDAAEARQRFLSAVGRIGEV